MKNKIAIIGAGISGSLLAYRLQKKGVNVTLFQSKNKPAASLIAGGMFNPITGKHLTKTWLFDDLYPYLFKFYPKLEQELNTRFFYPCGIIRILKNQNQKTQFLNRIKEQNLSEEISLISNFDWDNNPHSEALLIKNGGWVDVPKLLKAIENNLQNPIRNEHFNYEKLVIKNNSLSYEDETFEKIIFCEGYYAIDNPFFKNLPFKPVKGESMVANLESYNKSEIVNFSKWIINLGENNIRIGATYNWEDLSNLVNEETKKMFIDELENQGLKINKIIKMDAGVRPATINRRPIMGQHPLHKSLYIFNGLGTKGISLAPYFSELMVDFVEFGKELNKDLNINKINALY